MHVHMCIWVDVHVVCVEWNMGEGYMTIRDAK